MLQLTGKRVHGNLRQGLLENAAGVSGATARWKQYQSSGKSPRLICVNGWIPSKLLLDQVLVLRQNVTLLFVMRRLGQMGASQAEGLCHLQGGVGLQMLCRPRLFWLG